MIKKQVVSTEGIEETLGRWREDIKGKKRGIFSFEELTKLKLQELKECIYPVVRPISPWQIKECYYKNVGEYEFVDQEWRMIDVGDTWGGEGLSAFFRNKVVIPGDLKGEKVVLQLYLGGDSLVTINGAPYQGLDPFRNIVVLTECAEGGEEYNVEVESYYMWHAGEPEIKKVECSYIAVLDPEIEEIFWDYKSAFNALSMPQTDTVLLNEIKGVLKEAVAYINVEEENVDVFKENLRKGQKILKEKIYDNTSYRQNGTLSLIGNSHLDLVFLWDYAEFVRKAGRTHATMLRLMEQYPEFIFSQSQPVMYEEIRKNFPELFEQIKERIKEGRWEAIGAMWCEPDCNLISGESFVRQILHGTLYYEEHFGVTPKTCWLPDVFGNSYAMPQILKKSGVEYFVTHKMNIWNDTNPWPYNTFWWEGPDGSRVFGVVPPTHFIGTMEADSLKACWDRYTDKYNVKEVLYCYGWGDGGGGVDTEMLEYVKRYKSFPGLPSTQVSKAEDSLGRMMENATDLPVYKDELYLEAHRGVYTTKAILKKLNRYSENLYREIEMFGAIAELMYGYQYPADKIKEGWLKILTNQFHDSLPGSHINSVYYDLLKIYDEILKIGAEVKKEITEALLHNISTEIGKGNALAVFNPIAQTSTSIVTIDQDVTVKNKAGIELKSQAVTSLEGKVGTIFVAEKVPAAGYDVYYAVEGKSADKGKALPVTNTIETKRYCVTFNESAEITSLYDKVNQREVIRQGQLANKFRLFEDRPGKYEAWDIVATYVDQEIDVAGGKIVGIKEGDVCVEIEISKQILSSEIRQRIVLYHELDRIDFDTYINWAERRKLLKVEFNVDIYAKNYTSDIAYATIERSNCRYNKVDKAKFEASAHNFIDLSDDDYGVSILNDCKYGHEVNGNTMMLTLLKGPMNPDPESDLGEHYFTYSIYPHKENWKRAETLMRGLQLNQPLYAISFVPADKGLSEMSFVSVDADNIVLEALKKSEDGKGYILRVSEKKGRSGLVTVDLVKTFKDIYECNMIERDEELFAQGTDKLSIVMKPFEVKTFKMII
ncbi:MAG: Alpha-mannosidase [Herbinix sp.]|jgi:alpha-mannosidase|nr:Alpha-mannosidase [Herbinix sp.]